MHKKSSHGTRRFRARKRFFGHSKDRQRRGRWNAPTGGPSKPTTAPQTEGSRLQSIRLSCLSTRDKAWSSMAERMGQPLEILKMQEKKEIRCGHCNKLLGKGTARDLEIKCPRCGTLNHLRDMIPRSEPSDGLNGAFYADSEKEIGN